ncbi:MAG: ABC transporter substrate-binding protein [Lachnospiraceae bacterium]|nr:ABC transporter substrate-binding protein [Lachnospiraceae bacterium]
MKKRLVTMIAAAMSMTMFIAGCGGAAQTGSTDSQVAGAKTENTEAVEDAGDEGSTDAGAADKIIIFQSKAEIQDQLEDCAEAFTEETGIEVEIWGTTGDDYQQQLETKLANNQGPTIFTQQSGDILERLKDYCADLSDVECIGSIPEGLIEDIKIDGKTVGIPYTMEGFGIVYNKSLCDATTLKSTDDFVKMIKEQNDAGVSGFELTSEDYFLIGHILNTPFALMDDPDAFIKDLADGKAKMADQDVFKEFAQMMVSIRENCSNPLEQNYDGQIGDLATGKAAMIHQGNWCAGMFGDYEFSDAGMAPLPLAGNDKLAVSVPYYWAVNASADEAEQEAGKQFLTWLYTSETGKSYLYDQFGFVPVIKGDVNENLDVLSQDMQKYVEAGKTIGWNMAKWPANSINVYFAPLAQEFFTSDMSADDFLAGLDKAYADAIANQDK